ncbi:MAG: hypothetical protein HYZ90_03925 [Candidatus Omnitrophica bacterium]|nr:hypothetical protein [Candidatus Omnitrophota bacterium]
MPRQLQRYAVLVVLAASPFWLPASPVRPFGEKFRMTLASCWEPAYRSLSGIGVGFRSLWRGLLQGPALLEENRLLKGQIKVFEAHEETHRQLSEENARLRSLAVITPRGLVGKVAEVGPSVSRILLITDPHFRVAATLSKSRVSGLAVGTASGECRMIYLPLSEEFQAGEIVLGSGGRSFCPDGVPIGVLQGVQEDPSELFRWAKISPSVGLSSVEEVLIVAWPSSDSGS